MDQLKIIGISFQVEEDSRHIQSTPLFQVKRYQELMEKWLMDVTGLTEEQLKEDKTMESYLGTEWSYIRMERFIGKEGVDRRGVQYHTTPRQILERIRFLGREIHSNFWINALFSRGQSQDWVITDVNYPNEADAILDRGGIVYRVDHNPAPMGMKPSHMVKYPHYTERLITDGSERSIREIMKKILL